MLRLRATLLSLLPVCAGCAAIRGEKPPSATGTLATATQYWFRGVPQSEEMVAQVEALMTAPLKNGDELSVSAWGNYQLSSSTGDAAFASGNGGDFTEIDVVARYQANFEEHSIFGGAISYDFPNGVGLATTELFAGATFQREESKLAQSLTLYVDIDQADDLYATYGLTYTQPLDERFTATYGGLVGYMGEDQAALYFGKERAGLSDASVTGNLSFAYDEFTTVFARATAVAVPDGGLRDAEEDREFSTSAVVFTLGVSWTF
jgi:hypothetical protein